MNEPTQIDWSKLPEWAQWVAMDPNGDWYCFPSEPDGSENLIWCVEKLGDDCLSFSAAPFHGDWRDSLQQRPTQPQLEGGDETCLNAPAELRTRVTSSDTEASNPGAKSDPSLPGEPSPPVPELATPETPFTDEAWNRIAQEQDDKSRDELQKWKCVAIRVCEEARSLERRALAAEADSKADKNEILAKAQLLGSWSRQYHELELERDTLTTALHASEAKRVEAERMCLIKGKWAVGFQEGFAAAKAHLSAGKAEMFMGGGPRYSVLMTGPNHGIVNPLGETFPGSPDYYERTVMVRSELLDAAQAHAAELAGKFQAMERTAFQAHEMAKEIAGRLEAMPRVERCCECNGLVSDWVEADHCNSRICRPCESLIRLHAQLAAIKPLCDASVKWTTAKLRFDEGATESSKPNSALLDLLDAARAFATTSAGKETKP